jgi:plasmid maintenance system antidote protein VapI
MKAIHPGEHLAEELKEMGMSAESFRGSLGCLPTA